MKYQTYFSTSLGILLLLISILISSCGGKYEWTTVENQPPADNLPGEGHTPEEVEILCGNTPHESFQQNFLFADPGTTCDWNTNGNLSKIDLVIRARREQRQKLQLPSDAVICNMSFSATPQSMRFDDEIFLLFNDVVMASSFDYTDRLPVSEGLPQYDWLSLRNTKYESSNGYSPFCLGADSSQGFCSIPATETTGTIQIQFSQSLIYSLSSHASSSAETSLGFVTTGDNDNSDCRHLDFAFSISVEYVRKKAP